MHVSDEKQNKTKKPTEPNNSSLISKGIAIQSVEQIYNFSSAFNLLGCCFFFIFFFILSLNLY